LALLWAAAPVVLGVAGPVLLAAEGPGATAPDWEGSDVTVIWEIVGVGNKLIDAVETVI